MAGASFAVCTAAPTGDALCQGTSLTTTYTDITLGVPCTNVATATGPTSGVGCTNPGLSDSLGNVIVFGTSAIRWGQISGYLITPQTIPFAFPATSTSSIAFNSITPGTNTGALRIGTGGTLLPTGTGEIRSSAFVPYSSAQTAPGTLDYTGCSGQSPARNPFAWVPLANGHFAELWCMDELVVSPPASPAGTPEFTYRMWGNNTSTPMPGNKNRFFGLYGSPNLGGISSSASQQSSIFAVTWDNTAVSGLQQDYDQEQSAYSDCIIGGPNTNFHGHAGGEVDFGCWRGSMADSRTAVVGTAPTIFSTFSAQISRANAGAVMNGSEGKWVNYRGVISNGVATALGGTMNFDNFLAEGADVGPCSGSGCTYYGFRSRLPSPRFGNANFGFEADNFGTNAGDYDFVGTGVNASGTAAGFNAFVGPTALGAAAHCGAGIQVCVTGGTLTIANQIVSSLATGTAPFSVTSTTPVANLTAVPTTYNHSGTQQTAAHVIRDRCTLGTDCAVTLVGSAVFTSSSTYDCTAIDRTGANSIQFAPSSGSAFTLTGTGTDLISYICVGN